MTHVPPEAPNNLFHLVSIAIAEAATHNRPTSAAHYFAVKCVASRVVGACHSPRLRWRRDDARSLPPGANARARRERGHHHPCCCCRCLRRTSPPPPRRGSCSLAARCTHGSATLTLDSSNAFLGDGSRGSLAHVGVYAALVPARAPLGNAPALRFVNLWMTHTTIRETRGTFGPLSAPLFPAPHPLFPGPIPDPTA